MLHSNFTDPWNVSFGSNCDLVLSGRNVGFSAVSGLARGFVQCRNWAKQQTLLPR
jgi:hypothetical protein